LKLSIVEIGHGIKKMADAIRFMTPEYNRSVPGFLMNTIDIASRRYGHSARDGKPAAVISVSPGAMGFGANHHLRRSLVLLNMPTMTQPEADSGGAANLVDDRAN
jgi:chromate reductase, NAD(P)H dehydrogenase (quinone)